ncbi:MAG: hypothetical protein Rsou_0736 [Candidatus Ruthia sp. Asou_11_S2]|nr:hypothetical protein [Candidatus Ruthia sp. Asou_11_S2]
MKKILLLAILSFGLNIGTLAMSLDAIDTYKKACDLNDSFSCWYLGYITILLNKITLRQWNTIKRLVMI